MKPAAQWVPEIFRTAQGGWDAAAMAALVERIQADARADLQSLRQQIKAALANGECLTRTQLLLQLPDAPDLHTLSTTLSQMMYAGIIEKAGQCRWQLCTT